MEPSRVASRPAYSDDIDVAQPLVIVVCGDAGGAASLAPALRQLADEHRLVLRIYGLAPTYAKFAEAALTCDVPPTDWEAALADPTPSVVVTGTSWGATAIEKSAITTAQARGIPTLSVLDYWSNYRMRFSDENGRLVFLPDRIAIMDHVAESAMIAEGFPPERLVITGAPQLENIIPLGLDPATTAHAVRLRLGIHPTERVVLFVSQPLSQLYGTSLGFDERDVLAMTVSATARLSRETRATLSVCVRRHPRERVPLSIAGNGVLIRTAEGTADWESVLAADLVVGMTSVLLVKACYLGRVGISVQPTQGLTDSVPTIESGLTHLVRDETSLYHVMRASLFDDKARLSQAAHLAYTSQPQGSARRVANLIYDMAGVER